MEITLNVKLSASPELLEALKNITAQVTVWNDKPKTIAEGETTESAPKEKVKKEKPAKTEEVKEPKAAENGQQSATIGLTDIRQFVAKSEANKTAARALFPEYGIKALTDLPAEKFAEFYGKLTEPNDM